MVYVNIGLLIVRWWYFFFTSMKVLEEFLGSYYDQGYDTAAKAAITSQ